MFYSYSYYTKKAKKIQLFSRLFCRFNRANYASAPFINGSIFKNFYIDFTIASITFLLLFLTFAAQILIGIGLVTPANADVSEGITLEQYNDMIRTNIVISLEGDIDYNKVFLYINGENLGVFPTKMITVNVFQNSLIEIDGRYVKQKFTAAAECSDKRFLLMGKSIELNGNIKTLCRVIRDN